MRTKSSFAIVSLLLAVAPVLHAQQATLQPAAPAAKERATYRVDFVLTELEDGKKANSRTYTMLTEQGDPRGRSSLRVGSRVPVATMTGGRDGAPPVPTVQYMDVGVNIDCQIGGPENEPTFQSSSVEVSGITQAPPGAEQAATRNPVIRQMRASFSGAFTPGKAITVASADQVDSPRKMQVEVTATRLK